VLALAGPALFWDQGCIEREALTFVRQYTDARPLMNKVFDPHVNDLGTYQARELSYLLDLLDANAYPILASIFGNGFSIPLSAVTASLLLVVIFLWGARSTTVNVDQRQLLPSSSALSRALGSCRPWECSTGRQSRCSPPLSSRGCSSSGGYSRTGADNRRGQIGFSRVPQ
jgi:hypothetical protein